MKILKAKRLQKGDFISLIAPSGRVSSEKIEKSKQNIKKIGLKISHSKSYENYKYFSATDEIRLNELEESFKNNKNCDSIFCIRGGFGASRLLPNIDFDLIKNNPKIFLGFSDITALQSAFFVKTGLISFHGIIAASEFTNYITKQLTDLLIEPKENYILPIKSFEIIKNGEANGKIIGGNLSLLVSLIGTEYLYKFENNIVFIEEIAEAPYKIDRMLTQLLQATDLKKASAIVFGNFNKCEPVDFNMTLDESFSTEQIIRQNFADFNIPIVFNVNFGHIKDGLVFPIGVKASLKTEPNIEIKLIEKAVI